MGHQNEGLINERTENIYGSVKLPEITPILLPNPSSPLHHTNKLVSNPWT